MKSCVEKTGGAIVQTDTFTNVIFKAEHAHTHTRERESESESEREREREGGRERESEREREGGREDAQALIAPRARFGPD